VRGGESISSSEANQDNLYKDAADVYGSALERLARAYEADALKRQDLLQEIHFQLWRSFERFDGRCSQRTWIFRVSHNVAASHVIREKRTFARLVSLEQIEQVPEAGTVSQDHQINLDRLAGLIQKLKPLDRQVIVSYLEDLDAAAISELTGLSAASVAMRVHRIKRILARWFHEGGSHGE